MSSSLLSSISMTCGERWSRRAGEGSVFWDACWIEEMMLEMWGSAMIALLWSKGVGGIEATDLQMAVCDTVTLWQQAQLTRPALNILSVRSADHIKATEHRGCFFLHFHDVPFATRTPLHSDYRSVAASNGACSAYACLVTLN